MSKSESPEFIKNSKEEVYRINNELIKIALEKIQKAIENGKNIKAYVIAGEVEHLLLHNENIDLIVNEGQLMSQSNALRFVKGLKTKYKENEWLVGKLSILQHYIEEYRIMDALLTEAEIKNSDAKTEELDKEMEKLFFYISSSQFLFISNLRSIDRGDIDWICK